MIKNISRFFTYHFLVFTFENSVKSASKSGVRFIQGFCAVYLSLSSKQKTVKAIALRE